MAADLIVASTTSGNAGGKRSARRSICSPERIVEVRLEIFSSVHPGHIVFGVTDGRCMPLVRPGEVLVVEDSPRMYPQEGQWYLIHWISPPYNEWERHKVGQTIGIPHEIKEGKWGYRPPCQFHNGMYHFGDGIFSWEQMTDYIRGPVIGIYRPQSF